MVVRGTSVHHSAGQVSYCSLPLSSWKGPVLCKGLLSIISSITPSRFAEHEGVATADYSLMSLLLFFFLHTPVRFSEGSQSGSSSLYSDCAGLPLVKCRGHIRALRSDAESLQPGSLSFVFVTILTRIPHCGFLP